MDSLPTFQLRLVHHLEIGRTRRSPLRSLVAAAAHFHHRHLCLVELQLSKVGPEGKEICTRHAPAQGLGPFRKGTSSQPKAKGRRP